MEIWIEGFSDTHWLLVGKQKVKVDAIDVNAVQATERRTRSVHRVGCVGTPLLSCPCTMILLQLRYTLYLLGTLYLPLIVPRDGLNDHQRQLDINTMPRVDVPAILRSLDDPWALFNLSMSSFIDFIWDARRMPSKKRKQENRRLVQAYHLQSRIRDPVLALEELIRRIVYELITRTIEPDDIKRGCWLTCKRRDFGHTNRMLNLIDCIRSDPVVLDYAKRCDWLRLV